MSIQTNTETDLSTDSTVQTSAADEALVEDTLHVIEDNRKLAQFVYREEPFYDSRIQTALRKRFNWNVTKSQARAAVKQLGDDTVRRCARPHPDEM